MALHARRRIPLRDLSWNSLKRSGPFIVGLALFLVSGVGALVLLLAADIVEYSAWAVCAFSLIIVVIELLTRVGKKKPTQRARSRHEEERQ
jgi:hypothetical protein